MTSPASEYRAETQPVSTTETPRVRYPLTGRRYLLAALRARRGALPEQGSPSQSFAMARPRRMKRTARGLVWWIPIWYAVAQALFFLWMDPSWQLNRTRVEQQKWKQLHERIAQTPDRPLVLLLGSSRTDWGFQAGRLDGQPGPDGRPLLVYNFGVPTTGPLHEALYLNDLLDEGIRPRLLVVEFVTTHLNQARRAILSEERFTVSRWLTGHQLWFLRRYLNNSRRATTEWLEAWAAPWYGYRWSIHRHIQGLDTRHDPYDQAEQPADEHGSRILCEDPGTLEYRQLRWYLAVKMYGESLRRFQFGAKPAQAMRDLLARCQRERIPVALVLMPVTKEFRALINPKGRKDLNDFLCELREQYGTSVIDASDWLEREDFDDGHHLLKSGADKFSLRMVTEVKQLLAETEKPRSQEPRQASQECPPSDPPDQQEAGG